MMPAWCHIESPPTEDPDDDKPSQEEVHEMYCKHNAQHCREIFQEDCKPGNEMLPEWCRVEQPPTEPSTEGPGKDGAPPPPERIRPIFCKYNVQYCLQNFPGDCKSGNESVPIPEWCHAPNPPIELPTEGSDEHTTLVARQDDNPARQLFCEKNAEYCQEQYPGYCKPGNDKIPSWCHIKSSPTSIATSGPTLIARQDTLGKRTPQDPDREEEERERRKRRRGKRSRSMSRSRSKSTRKRRKRKRKNLTTSRGLGARSTLITHTATLSSALTTPVVARRSLTARWFRATRTRRTSAREAKREASIVSDYVDDLTLLALFLCSTPVASHSFLTLRSLMSGSLHPP